MSAIENVCDLYLNDVSGQTPELRKQQVRDARSELFEIVTALVSAEKYMKHQRALSKAPFDPEALKRVRAVLSNFGGGITPRAADGATACPQCGHAHNDRYCPKCSFGYS